MVDTERIKKLLNLTTSTFNGEALNAIRKANEELQKNKQTWDDVLEGKGGSKSTRSFADDFANKMIIDSLQKQAKELRTERNEYKKDYYDVRSKYIDLKAEVVKIMHDIYTGKPSGKAEPQKEEPWHDNRREYIPKSKRGRR